MRKREKDNLDDLEELRYLIEKEVSVIDKTNECGTNHAEYKYDKFMEDMN